MESINFSGETYILDPKSDAQRDMKDNYARDYHKAYTPVTWRDFWAFGCGAMGDFGCHDMDAAVWAYDLQAPESV